MTIPFSSLASPEAKRNFMDLVNGFDALAKARTMDDDIAVRRKRLDDMLLRPGVEKLRRVFAVNIQHTTIGGVPVDVIEPATGVAPTNKRRVLIELHGGGFRAAAGLGGQMESIPVASLGGFKVIAVDYREAPEYRFPAASEDVATVYRELLKQYSAGSIGIYGCSAGAVLTGEALAWFQVHGLPTPGAIGLFGEGVAGERLGGDSVYFAQLLTMPAHGYDSRPQKVFPDYYDVPHLDPNDPLVSQINHPEVLAAFPPTLLVSGTRDVGLSEVIDTHVKLVKAGVDAELHIWDGACHCSYAQPVVDPSVPETREAWDVIVKFFDKHLKR